MVRLTYSVKYFVVPVHSSLFNHNIKRLGYNDARF
jgi:hypothetical protein